MRPSPSGPLKTATRGDESRALSGAHASLVATSKRGADSQGEVQSAVRSALRGERWIAGWAFSRGVSHPLSKPDLTGPEVPEISLSAESEWTLPCLRRDRTAQVVRLDVATAWCFSGRRGASTSERDSVATPSSGAAAIAPERGMTEARVRPRRVRECSVNRGRVGLFRRAGRLRCSPVSASEHARTAGPLAARLEPERPRRPGLESEPNGCDKDREARSVAERKPVGLSALRAVQPVATEVWVHD